MGCSGLGVVESWGEYGEEMKRWRVAHGLSIRAACRKYNVDPSNVSKMERGLIKPKRYWG